MRAASSCVRLLTAGLALYFPFADAGEGVWQFPPLPGPYQVGTADLFWVDRDRPEPGTSDPHDVRHLLVKVWYPAAPTEDAKLAPYLPNLEEFTEEAADVFNKARDTTSRSYIEAPIIESDKRLPVLIYNHGGGWSRFTSRFITEVMASYGYVVFSIDHTGFNKSTVFPDGYIYENDALPRPEDNPDNSVAENARAFFDYLEDSVFDLWVQDAIFALNKIEAMSKNDKGRFADLLDLDRVGAFGWSFGGAAAIQLTRADSRIRAAVNHDGQLFGDVRETGTDKPVMLLHSSVDLNPENDEGLAALVDEIRGWNKTFLEKSSNDWYDATITGSSHLSFSDLVLFMTKLDKGPGDHDYLRQHKIIMDLTRDFFDKYLRGLSETPLLKGELENYPELILRSNIIENNLADVRIPMRDGTELSMDIYLPDGAGPFPTVLLRTPYEKSKATFKRYKLGRYVSNGYAVALQATRGQGLSGGDFEFFFAEGADGYDTIEWIASQIWSNGKVAMDGGSYLGTVQWLAALNRPPHLECIMPHASWGRIFNEFPYVGGAFALQSALPWIAPRYPDTSTPNNQKAVAEILTHRPLLTMDKVYSGRELPLYRDMLTHSTLDDYWKPLNVTPEDFETLDIPALTITGWFDGDQSGALFYWSGMRAKSTAADLQYLIIGPWKHAETYLNGGFQVGEIELSSRSVLDIQSIRLHFLNWCLKGETRTFRMPRALVYLTGVDRWLELDNYPASATKTHSLFLSSAGNANTSGGDGRLTPRPPSRNTPDRYTYDPQEPVPTLAGATDHSVVEERQDVLVYTGPILKAPLAVLGSPVVELYASSDARDTDFTAKLLDVRPDGRAIKINWTLGAIRARYRNGYERRELLIPNEPTTFRIELSDIGHVFQPGHRVRIEISSSNFPYISPNQNTGNPVATDIDWRVANQTIHHSQKLPSRLILPVLPDEYMR